MPPNELSEPEHSVEAQSKAPSQDQQEAPSEELPICGVGPTELLCVQSSAPAASEPKAPQQDAFEKGAQQAATDHESAGSFSGGPEPPQEDALEQDSARSEAPDHESPEESALDGQQEADEQKKKHEQVLNKRRSSREWHAKWASAGVPRTTADGRAKGLVQAAMRTYVTRAMEQGQGYHAALAAWKGSEERAAAMAAQAAVV